MSGAVAECWDLPAWQLVLAQLSDSALPTGAFSHSLGMETYVLDGAITDDRSLVEWLTTLVSTQLGCGDAIAIRETCRARDRGDTETIWWCDAMLHAQTLPSQVRAANHTIGSRTTSIAAATLDDPLLQEYLARVQDGRCHGHPAIAVALAGSALGCPVGVLVAQHLHAVVTGLVQNAVRAVPLGQDAGQRALTAMRPVVEQATRRTEHLGLDDFGATSFGLELGQMRHERTRARMYMS